MAHFTPEEYLAYERRNEFKSEYLNGEIVAMTGASRKHNRIVLNLAFSLHGQLRKNKSCEVYANDMRVRVLADNLYTYPDVVAACGEPRFEDDEVDTLLNPVLIAEVLSRSTERYDRGAKLRHYKTIPSFVEYLFVAQDRIQVDHSLRDAEGRRWVSTQTEDLNATLVLPSIGCTLLLADIYDRVFP